MCSKGKPYPPAFYTASDHDRSRMQLCIICMALLPRKLWRDSVGVRNLHIPDSNGLRKLAEELLPGFDPATHMWMPTSFCEACRRRQRPEELTGAVERFNAAEAQQQLARDCDGTLCEICRTVTGESVPANQSAPPMPTDEDLFRAGIADALSAALFDVYREIHSVITEYLLRIIAGFVLFCKFFSRFFGRYHGFCTIPRFFTLLSRVFHTMAHSSSFVHSQLDPFSVTFLYQNNCRSGTGSENAP